MKKIEKFDYLLFAGKTKDDLHPIASFPTKEDAIVAAHNLLELCPKVYKYIEVTFMPEDDVDTNEVVWSNCGRK